MTRSGWHKLSIGAEVFDLADPRHLGEVLSIEHGVANVRWTETGWRSQVPVTELRNERERERLLQRPLY